VRAAVLVGYAESDFRSDATQDGHEGGTSHGVFQQKPEYYPGVGTETGPQCDAFLDRFAQVKRTGDLVRDCWQVQRWAPSKAYDASSPETLNYTVRVNAIDQIISTRRLP
jgi:hypothetical protein